MQQQKAKSNMFIQRQEQLIAQKKEEIEARLAAQAKMKIQTTNNTPPPR